MSTSNGQKMTISQGTRTHLIYQFIILTLLFVGIGYNELLPERKFIILLIFLPIFCYQLVILCYFLELISVPSWMSFLQPTTDANNRNAETFDNDFSSSSSKVSSHAQTKNQSFLEIGEISPCMRRREKSVTNLRTSPKLFDCPQKSKSWMNLSDSKSSEALSREGSIDALVSMFEKKSKVKLRSDKVRSRVDRAAKAKSWKPNDSDFDTSERGQLTKSTKLQAKLPSFRCREIQQEDSELAKSYSFPFRQKRIETWLDRKETNVTETDQSPGMPYWQTVGYNLAVKYEARRRRRAISNQTRTEGENEEPSQKFQRSIEIVPDSASTDKINSKKSVKSASARINKIKVGFSNLMSKRKEEAPENNAVNTNKVSKPALLFKLKNKNVFGQTKEKDSELATMPEFPQFLTDERPLIFYPKYIPFEKERFEGDVKRKMIELAEEQNESLQQLI